MAKARTAKRRDADDLDTDRLINSKQIVAIVPYSLFHLSRLEDAGKFPKRIKLGGWRIAWSLREVEEWIAARKDERKRKPTKR